MRTPATQALSALGLAFELRDYEEIEKTAEEVARKLDLAQDVVFKTLLATSAGQFALAVVPCGHTLSLRALARVWGTPSAQMADPKDITRVTGYVRGSVSPLGTRRKLQVFVDESALRLPQMAISAGARGWELLLAPDALRASSGATFAAICQGV